jgi:DNA-binding transcriptional ArsR family regulator
LLTLQFGIFRSFANQGVGDKPSALPSVDPSFKRAMVYLFMGTRGGRNRVKIVELVKSQPSNSNRISELLSLDYKTVQHHVKVLSENGVLVANEQGGYGAMYFLTPYFEKHYDLLRGMWAEFGQSEK